MGEPDKSAALQDLVRGRLSPDEARRLKDAINADPELEAEYRLIAALNEVDPAPHALPSELGWAKLEKAIDNEPPRRVWGANITLWQAAACVAIAVVAWQFTVAPRLVGNPADPSRYETASMPDHAGVAVRIAFAPAATEAAIRALLRESQARIVDGPSAVGLYTLVFNNDEARAAGLQRFAASPSVVTTVDAD